jgi:hypothetical protein
VAWYVDSIRLAEQGMDAEAMRVFSPTWTEEQRRLRAEWLPTCYEPAVVSASTSEDIPFRAVRSYGAELRWLATCGDRLAESSIYKALQNLPVAPE